MVEGGSPGWGGAELFPSAYGWSSWSSWWACSWEAFTSWAWSIPAWAAFSPCGRSWQQEDGGPSITTPTSWAVYYYANQLAYAERVMYWATGLKTFGLHPLLGVGLGNSGFLFRQSLPVYGYFLPEMIAILNGAPGFPNPKNLWVRLLAETGVVGFLLFTIWLARIGLAAHRLSRGQASVLRVIGAAGLIALATQVIEGFSLDSFALPQLWIMLGLVTAGASISSVSSPRADGKSDSVPFRST